MTAIQTVNLTKDFKGRRAVDNLSLTINEGEVFALLGTNGAGKTTAIKMLCCLLAPTSGDALLLGDSILTSPDAVKQKINISPQETAVAPKLSVVENLEFMARIYGSDKHEARARAEEMMKALRLTDRAKDRAKSLSGGLQRRLSIAMALISRPKVVFLDEPTLGLDVGSRRDLWDTLNGIRGDATIVLTTHYLEEAEAHADRIAIMHAGKLQAIGTAQELKQTAGKETFEDAFLALTGTEEQR
jgi:ABC-2 type transport system ATP-binding protein